MSEFLKDIKIAPLIVGSAHELSIILDTNVLSYMLIPEAKMQIDKLLEDYAKNGTNLKLNFVNAVSSVSIYECLQGDRPEEYIELFKKLKCYEINIDVQYTAAKLQKYYKSKGLTNLNLPDLYIGATSILTINGILTANHTDFPSNLFEELDSKNIHWKINNRTQSAMLYLLAPVNGKGIVFLNSIK